MKVKNLAVDLLLQLKNVALSLNEIEYSNSLSILGNSSIGAHIRHSLEFIQMLLLGIETGEVSYDNRKHDKQIESNPLYASMEIDTISEKLESISENIKLRLKVEYKLSNIETVIDSTLERELIYNIEHIVHHMAIIKIGLKQHFPNIELSPEFGIAQSTIVFQSSEA